MTVIAQLLDAYPRDLGRVDRAVLERCIAACFECEQACTACADACLSERSVAEQTKCIRTNLDCADVCGTTGRVLSRHTGYDAHLTEAVLDACRLTCRSCADQCEGHAAVYKHCEICAASCRTCQEVCKELAHALYG